MKRFVAACLTTIMITSTLASYGFAERGNNGNYEITIKRYMVNDKFKVPEFVSGKLTKPSKEKPENIVKDYFQEKNHNKNYELKKKFKNSKNQTIVKLHQTYKGIKVRGTEQSCIVNNDGVLEAVSGLSIPDIDSRVKGNIQLTENEAASLIGKELQKDMSKADFLSIEKAILPQKDDAIYVYEVKVSFNEPCLESWNFVIDSSTGKILEKTSALRFESVQVDGKGVFGDTKTMTGYKGTIPDLNIVPEHPYSLADTTKTPPSGAVQKPTKILTYELIQQNPSMSNIDGTKKIASDGDGHFIEDNSKSHAVDAHYNAGKVYDFYKEWFGRYGFDNNGSNIITNCHAIFGKNSDGTYDKNNACWDEATKQIYFGDGDGTDFYGYSGDPNMMGHEFTHGVTNSEVNMLYYGESGSIDEALSDLFGEAFESYLYGRNPDWLKFKDCYTPSTPGDYKIDYKNPRNTTLPDSTRKYPDHMDNKFVGNLDYNGVHINAAILTKAFSLMSDGGSFRNVDVSGIGMNKLSTIMYKVITEYLANPETTFNQFAQLCLDAADSLYGQGSAEYKSVKSGFLAVGIPYNTSQWKSTGEKSDVKTLNLFNTLNQLNNKLYSFGGYQVVNNIYISDVNEFDISQNKWTVKNNMPLPRALAKSAAVNQRINVLFGFSDSNDYTSFYTTVDEYNPATDSWNSVASLPEKSLVSLSSYTAGTVLRKPIEKTDGYFLLKTGQMAPGASISIKIEGSNDNVNFTEYEFLGTFDKASTSNKIIWNENDVRKYYRIVATVNSGTCSFEVTAPYFRDFPSVVSHNNKIFVLGGQNAGTYAPILHMDVYDTISKTWNSSLPGLTSPRPNKPILAVATINNLPKLYVFGGGSRNIEVYDINSGTWNHSAGTCPELINANGVSAAFYNGKIHFLTTMGYTFIYNPATGVWTENNDVGSYNENGFMGVYQNSLYNISVDSQYDRASLKVEYQDPLRITGFENNNNIILQWSNSGSASSTLTIDGTTAYTGTNNSYKYTSFANGNNKHIIKVAQNHPIYANTTSKSLCTVYRQVGDIDGNGTVDTTDLSILKRYTLNLMTPNNLQKISADINNDNTVDSIDYTILYRHMYINKLYHSIGTTRFMIYGDVDNDGTVTMDDYSLVNESLSNGSALSIIQTVTADVDGDGSVTATDSNLIRDYVLNENIIFPAAN